MKEVLTLSCLGSYYEWMLVGWRSMDHNGFITIRDARVIHRWDNEHGGPHGLATNPKLVQVISAKSTTKTNVHHELWHTELDESVWLKRFDAPGT